MKTDDGLLTLAQWLSPGFPTGGFAYSHGLEAEIALGRVHDATSLSEWLGQILSFGSGRQDAILLSLSLAPGADLDGLDATARALAPSRERMAETVEQGTAFARTTAAVTGRDLPPRVLPVAVAQAVAPLGLPAALVAGLYMQAFAANLVACAVRFVPLGQTEGQAVLAALRPLILRIAAEAASAGPDDITSATLRADLASMQHETMDVRIYRT